MLLTAEEGRLYVTAKGARKGASRLAAGTEPLVHAQFGVSGGAHPFVTQVQPITSFRGLRQDFDRLTLALAVAEFYAATAVQDLPGDVLLQSLLEALESIEKHPHPLVAATWSFLVALDQEGVAPSFLSCAVSGKEIHGGMVYASPSAGGYVCDAESVHYRDSFPTQMEILVGLGRTAELAAPPPNLKYAETCLVVLSRFLTHNAHRNLPSLDLVLDQLKTE